MAHVPLNAPHGANRRQDASKNDNARQKKTAHDEERQAVSSGAILSLSWCSEAPGKENFSGRATFSGAKPITEMDGSTRCDEHSSGREGDWLPRIRIDSREKVLMNSVHRAHRQDKGDAFMSLQTARHHGAQHATPSGRQYGSRTPKRLPTSVGRSDTSATSSAQAKFPSMGDRAYVVSAGIC